MRKPRYRGSKWWTVFNSLPGKVCKITLDILKMWGKKFMVRIELTLEWGWGLYKTTSTLLKWSFLSNLLYRWVGWSKFIRIIYWVLNWKQEMLGVLLQYRAELGGSAKRLLPGWSLYQILPIFILTFCVLVLDRKVTRREFESNYSDFEYIYLSILSFQQGKFNIQSIPFICNFNFNFRVRHMELAVIFVF